MIGDAIRCGMRVLVLVFVIVIAIGCNKQDPGPPCDQVVDHLLDVTKQQLTGHGGAELGNRAKLIAECKERKSPAYNRCALGAKDLTGLAECTKLLKKP